MVQSLAHQRLAQSLVTAINDLGTQPQCVIGANATRTGITFHNPGSVTLLVFPKVVLVYGQNPGNFLPSPVGGGVNMQGYSQVLVPSVNQLGGGFLMCPGATLFFGEPTCQQAWQALAMAGSNNPLTVMEQG